MQHLTNVHSQDRLRAFLMQMLEGWVGQWTKRHRALVFVPNGLPRESAEHHRQHQDIGQNQIGKDVIQFVLQSLKEGDGVFIYFCFDEEMLTILT